MTGDPKIKIEMWPVENLIPYELNVKKHDAEQVARIVKTIQQHGWDVPIVVDKYGVIIKGHGRRMAALELGLKKVPVIVRVDLSPEQVRAARLADNRVAISDIDTGMLREELAGLNEELIGIFDDKELEFLSADLGAMDSSAFVSDMGAVLDEQRADIDARSEKATSPDVRVPVAKALGFKDISAAGQLAVSQLMARAEAITGLQRDAALVAFASKYLEGSLV